MLIDRVGVAGALRDTVVVHSSAVGKDQVDPCEGVSSSDGKHVVGQVAAHAEGARLLIEGSVAARQDQGHRVRDDQIGAARDEGGEAQIDLQGIDRCRRSYVRRAAGDACDRHATIGGITERGMHGQTRVLRSRGGLRLQSPAISVVARITAVRQDSGHEDERGGIDWPGAHRQYFSRSARLSGQLHLHFHGVPHPEAIRRRHHVTIERREPRRLAIPVLLSES